MDNEITERRLKLIMLWYLRLNPLTKIQLNPHLRMHQFRHISPILRILAISIIESYPFSTNLDPCRTLAHVSSKTNLLLRGVSITRIHKVDGHQALRKP